MTVGVFNAPDIGLEELRRVDAEPLPPDGSASHRSLRRDFSRLLAGFASISLAEMDKVALLDRVDTKYVMSTYQLHSTLAALPEYYRVLEVEGVRMNRYRTLYFDTDDFLLYMNHHSGRAVRYKVRSREYLDTGRSFLEVKWKAKRDRTVKERIPTGGFLTQLVPGSAGPVVPALPDEDLALEPKVYVEFYRITLVGKHHSERVTLDLGLRFHGEGRTIVLPSIAVAEVKQSGADRGSHFIRHMRATGIRPSGFSKYCIGVSMIYQDVKHNEFKPTLRLIGRLTGEDHDVR